MPSGKLLDVWSAAENDAWAPGESGALHFDGSSWKYLQGVAGSNFFTGAYGFAPNDAWLFGPAMGLMHWNGSTLTSALTPTTSGSPVGLWGASSTDLYVADFGGLFHYDGSALALVTIPNVANAKWNDVWGFPNGDLWVVRKAEVKRREGGNWVNKVPLNFAATPERIWGINENDLWLTGFNITLHWTGTAFETLSLSAPFSSGSCSAAHGVAANDVWLTCTMGYLAPEDAFKIGPAMLHWNGTAVTVSETGTRGPDQGLTSVFARTADDVWAVGTRKSIVRRRK